MRVALYRYPYYCQLYVASAGKKMWQAVLVLSLSAVFAHGCDVSFQWWSEPGMWLVRYTEPPCNTIGHYFCQDSGWGSEEATVVCREQGYSYGIGRYVAVKTDAVGYAHIECQGTESTLEECTVGQLTSEPCSQLAVVSQCSNVPQLSVSGLLYNPTLRYHLSVFEQEQTQSVCVVINGQLLETVHIHVETRNSDTIPAIADYDYRPLSYTLTFEPSDMTGLEQCLEIEIIDDALAEDWEMFTVQLSTDSSAVNLTLQEFDVHIFPNDAADGSGTTCTEGSVTVTSDSSNNSLQLVEMCSNEGVWSPVCDHDWTLEDATVVCRELGFEGTGTETHSYAVLDSGMTVNSYTTSCEGEETTLAECPTQTEPTLCKYLLVKCTSDRGPDDEGSDGGNTPTSPPTPANEGTTDVGTTAGSPDTTDSRENHNDNSSNTSSSGASAGVVAGVVVALIVALLTVIIVVVCLIVWLKRRTKNFEPTNRSTGNTTPPTSSLEGATNSDVKQPLSLPNPTYEPNIVYATMMEGTLEHNLVNPLYTTVGRNERDVHDYAQLESSYSNTGGAGSAARRGNQNSYEYVETSFHGDH